MFRSGPRRKRITRWSHKFLGGPRYLEIPANADVLLIEDSLDRILRFKTSLPNARLAASASTAIAELKKKLPEFVFLDRDLAGPSFGEEVAEFLAAQKFAGRVIVTSANLFGVEVISKILTEAGIEFEAIPFSMFGVVRIGMLPGDVPG